MKNNRLLQLFKDNSCRGNFQVKAEGEEATIYLYDAIGDFFGIEAQPFIEELNNIKAKTIHLRINSPGGDVFDGRAIATAIKQCKAKVVSHIDGVCASAATYIALAANEVEMADGAFFMVHKAWSLVIGDSDDMLSMADLLEKVDGTIVSDYAKKTGLDDSKLKDMMAAETWLTAAEAKELNFIDTIYEGEEVENTWNLAAYENVPDECADKFCVNRQKKEEVVYDKDRFEKRLSLFERQL